MRAARQLLVADAVLAVALAAGCLLEIWSPRLMPGVGEVVGDRIVLTATSLPATLPLAFRRRYPFATLSTVIAALSLQQALTTPVQGLVLLFAMMVAAYSSSVYASPGRASAAGVVVIAGAAAIGTDVGDRAFIAIMLGGAWLVGFVVMQRSNDLQRAREDNQRLSTKLAEAADQLEEAHRRLATGPGVGEVAALTAREVEVARSIARGMSNAEIAADLSISEWTVKTHVANILRKLGLRDRAQVVVAAYESGLVEPFRRGGQRSSPSPGLFD